MTNSINILPKRKNIRIPKYNYSNNGYYFITICTQKREKILSNVVGVDVLGDPKIELTSIGKIVQAQINEINSIYENIRIDDYVIMPNHIHMVCIIDNYKNGAPRTSPPTDAQIPFLISTLKRFVNKKCKMSIWQRNYYEHVIRNEKEYLAILEYIQYNPLNWIYDKYY